ncbi:MAG: tail fiber domain-containing protein, partial [Sphingobacterium sp.]
MKIQAPSTRTSFILVFLLGLCNVLQAQILDEKQMKLNIKKIVNPLEQLQSLNPITYNYNIKDFKELDLPEGNHAGFLLTEVETTLPDIIKIENKVYQEGKNNTK